MRRRRSVLAVVAATALGTGLAAGGDDGGSEGSGDESATKAEFNAGFGKVFNPSDAKGGTLRFANSGDWDSLDPVDTYYA